MSGSKISQKVILFSCNWHAFSSMEAAGRDGFSIPPGVIPLRVSCLGRISPGIILKAFESGADGVILLGCPEGQCHYQTGNLEAKAVYEETQSLLKLLGLDERRLAYHRLPAEDGAGYQETLKGFLELLKNGRNRS